MRRMIGGIQVETCEYLGDIVAPQMPEWLLEYRGPYRQRKWKRWRLAHPARRVGTGAMFLSGNRVLLHPDDVPKLVELLNTGWKR